MFFNIHLFINSGTFLEFLLCCKFRVSLGNMDIFMKRKKQITWDWWVITRYYKILCNLLIEMKKWEKTDTTHKQQKQTRHQQKFNSACIVISFPNSKSQASPLSDNLPLPHCFLIYKVTLCPFLNKVFSMCLTYFSPTLQGRCWICI